MDKAKLKKKAFLYFPLGILATALLIFLPAGTIAYWQAWVYFGTLMIPLTIVASYLFKHNPELLKKRLQYKEKDPGQKKIIKFSFIFYLLVLLIPGIDVRFGWSNVPVLIVIMADIIIFSAYMLVFLVFKENTYTSRIIEVVKGQKVISTGPYAEIRHPMYTGMLLIMIFTPMALGSYWAMTSDIPIIAMIIFRLINEEQMLLKKLDGYKEYTKKVKYRLIPGLW